MATTMLATERRTNITASRVVRALGDGNKPRARKAERHGARDEIELQLMEMEEDW
jgi:hypothetical protein